MLFQIMLIQLKYINEWESIAQIDLVTGLGEAI